MAAFEVSLGVKLFTRSLDGLSPTEAGLRLIRSAEAMAAAADAGQRSVSGAVDEERGTVRISASEVIGGEVLPLILADFQDLHPQTSMEISLTNRSEGDMFAFRADSNLAQLAASRVGLGIDASQLGIARRDSSLVPVLHAELIFSMEVWVAMHRDLRNNRRICLMFDHLASELTRYAESSRHEA